MPVARFSKRQKWLLYTVSLLVLLAVLFSIFVNRFIEPALRSRIHTLIVQGSDSLYTYELGRLDANFFGGNVEVRNLHIQIDSNRYRQLAEAHALPALTMELDLVNGQIKGVAIFALLFSKQVIVNEIVSKDANVRLLRHVRDDDAPRNTQPLWKTLQPAIKSIAINQINLDGVKLLYRNADTSDAIKLQFDRCTGLFDDIRIDSAASADTARIAFTKSINLQFNDLKFRTPDSSYKMKAEVISYSSRAKTFEVVDFKIQPTLEDKESFYKAAVRQQTMHVIEYKRMKLTNVRLDHFINNNIIAADSLIIDQPDVKMYSDKTLPPHFDSKVGGYPHQKLLQASSTIIFNVVSVRGAALSYTEKAEKTKAEGTLLLKDLNIDITNVTNDSARIKRQPECVLTVNGKILDTSPLQAQFRFYLADTTGRFDMTGDVRSINAAQLNAIAEPLANVKIRSFNISRLEFAIRGDDFGAESDVAMWYNDLFVILQKEDAETGEMKTKKFMTKLLNRFTLYDSNPGPDGVVRKAVGAKRARVSSQSFFGLVWKSLFTGMQGVMMKSGRYE